MSVIKKQITTKADEDMDKKESLYIAGRSLDYSTTVDSV